MPDTFHDYHFPKAGIDKSEPAGRQPVREGAHGVYVRTTPIGANVRSFDPASKRERGGSRSGLSKFISTQVNGTFITQHLNVIVTNSQGGGVPQTSQSGRTVTLVAVSQGVVKVANPDATAWTAVTNNTGVTPALNFSGVMQSSANNQKLYFADGTNWVYYKPTTNSLETWTATSGTLPVDSGSNKPRLICTWRGRTVLSGLLLDPQNWFMSRVSDPHDFNYAPTANDAKQAVAGNNEALGIIGDNVTALIPWTDDTLIFGGDSSIYRMTGDPLHGGQIDRVTTAMGIAWGQAWCMDPYGRVYFMSNQGDLYRMDPPMGAPIRISQPIEKQVKAINTGTNVIRLSWDDNAQGIHVYVTLAATTSTTTHYFWEAPRGNRAGNAWWTDTFANNNHNPVTCVTFDGNDANDRVMLIGSWDGYVRVVDKDATTDDGTNIASSVVIGPILTQELDEMLLKDLQAVLAIGSGSVTYTVHTGPTAEEALVASAAVTGTWSAGRNPVAPIRRADHAIYIKITATTRWAMEVIRARFEGKGKVRRSA